MFTIIAYQPAYISGSDIYDCSQSNLKIYCGMYEEDIVEFVSNILFTQKKYYDTQEDFEFTLLIDGRNVLNKDEKAIYASIMQQAKEVCDQKIKRDKELEKFEEEKRIRLQKEREEKFEKEQLQYLKKKYPNVFCWFHY